MTYEQIKQDYPEKIAILEEMGYEVDELTNSFYLIMKKDLLMEIYQDIIRIDFKMITEFNLSLDIFKININMIKNVMFEDKYNQYISRRCLYDI